MVKKNDDEPDLATILLETFRRAPWYVGPLCAAFVYCLMKWIVPWIWPLPSGETKGPELLLVALVGMTAQVGPVLAPLFGGVILFVWGIARIIRYIEALPSRNAANTTRRDPLSADSVSLESPTFIAKGVSSSEAPPKFETHVKPVLASIHVVPTVDAAQQIEKTATQHDTKLVDISKLKWHEFEKLLVQVLRRLGFQVEHTGRKGPDGGFDVRCTDSKGQFFLVQCKHWQWEEVGVKIVREFFGAINHEGAKSGLIVTSGLFTQDAKKLGAEDAIRLIDGEELLRVLSEVPEYCDGEKLRYRISHLESAISSEQCPRCAGRMIRKNRKNGSSGAFLGCERYPDCTGSRSI